MAEKRVSGVELGTTFNRAVRTPRGIAGIVVGLAGVVLAIAAAFAGPQARAGSATVPGLAVSSAVVPRLDAIAKDFAKHNGDHKVQWATAVITTHGKALESATPGDTEPAGNGAVVYLITIKGKFVGDYASVPAGAKLPTGNYMSIVVNARTFAITDWGLSPKAPPVAPASLGPVRYLIGAPRR
jgi:hypothetical protein